MKKIFVLLLALVMSVSAFAALPVMAEENSEKIEITFKVGDSVLFINGKEVEVETPYVVGKGTTLVPLRVITEAFGAKVGWEEETQKITLEYPDVNIVLQIGNIEVIVNDHTETLLAAPELPKDTTMVPLRFISETFGATVTYDEATELITVTKEISNETETPLKGITTKERIGDSYYNWSMNTPAELFMEDRNFDGSLTYFSGDDSVRMYVNISHTTEENDFEAEFDYYKNGTYGTLSVADKKTDADGNKYMHLRSKTPTTYTETYRYYTEKYIYAVVLSIAVDSDAINDMYAITESFDLNFDEAITHDLSNVKDGHRTYENEEYKLSFDLPANWADYSYEGVPELYFMDASTEDTEEFISLNVYSLSDTVSAQKLSKHDRDVRARYSSDLVKVSEVEEFNINDTLKGYKYIHEIKGSAKLDGHLTDIFFDLGDYTYNVTLKFKKENKAIVDRFLSSLKIEKLDAEKTGTILNPFPTEDTVTSSNKNWSITLPSIWAEENTGFGEVMSGYANQITGSLITVSTSLADGATYENVKEYIDSNITELKSTIFNIKIVKEPYDVKINNLTYRSFEAIVPTEDSGPANMTAYATIIGNKLVTFTTSSYDIGNTEASKKEINDIISSFKLK